MNIGIIHYRIGQTDGVSLEINKWNTVLRRIYPKCYLISGDLNDFPGFKIPSIEYLNTKNLILKQKSFLNLGNWTERKYIEEINLYANKIYNELEELMPLDLLIVENIFSLAHNLSAAIAIYNFCKNKGIKLIGHHHDFYWERNTYQNSTNKYTKEILNRYFPPKDITHVVINSIAQQELKKRKNLNSYVIPNVFDFNQKQWTLDKYNIKIYDQLKISKNDLIFLQATRIVKRKAIELAIDTLSEINKDLKKHIGKTTYTKKPITKNTKASLLLPGISEEQEYTTLLKKHAKEKNVELKFASSICNGIRHEEQNIFSLWDFYAIADFITYPSIFEGFGNQFLEAIFSKKPILLFEYPVYRKDLSSIGFKIVTLGSKAEIQQELYKVNKQEIQKAKQEIFNILFQPEKAKQITETNFELGKKYFSYEVLENKVKQILFPEEIKLFIEQKPKRN